MNKRRIGALVLAGMLCLLLVGCGGQSVEGTTWTVTRLKTDGKEITQEDLALLGLDLSYTFKEDGVLEILSAGKTLTGSWAQEGELLTVHAEGTELTAEMEGDSFTLVQNGAEVEFSKKKA